MTANELLKIARKNKPYVTYTTNDKENVIGAWSNEKQRFVAVACLTLTGEWVSIPGELFVDGKPMVDNTWKPVEVTR